MKVHIIKAEHVCSRGKYTHSLAEAIKVFVERDDIFSQDIRIIGEDSSLTAIMFYEEIKTKEVEDD